MSEIRYRDALRRIRLQADSEAPCEELEDAQRDLRTIHAIATEALHYSPEKDAARYRWLREHWEELSGQSFRGSHPPGKGGYLLHKSDPTAVDAAVDAAMAKAMPAQSVER